MKRQMLRTHPLKNKEKQLRNTQLLVDIVRLNDKGILNHIDEKTWWEIVEISVKNKVFLLLYEQLTKCGYTLPNSIQGIANEHQKRKREYENILKELSQIASIEGIDFLVAKTIKYFPYAGSDVDILLPTDEEFNRFENALKKHGYILLGGGKREATFKKNTNREDLLVDVHRVFSAAGIIYLNTERLWKSKLKAGLGDYEVYVLPTEEELLLLSTHSILKELRITLADFFQALYLLDDRVDWDRLYALMKKENAKIAFLGFMSAISAIHQLLYGSTISLPSFCASHVLKPVIMKITTTSLNKQLSMPYYYHPLIVTMAYMGKFGKNPAKLLGLSMDRFVISRLFKYCKKDF